MQNFVKSQTRLAFVQFIFQSEFSDTELKDSIDDFQKYFYNSNIALIGDEKVFNLKFNTNFLKKLSENYINNFDKKKISIQLNRYNELERKFEKWNGVLRSLIIALISELQITEKKKIKIIINDYINIAKSLVTTKETKLMNAIIQKYIDEKEVSTI
tara:strand:+ start:547 stop:1017 length:471 start_codon:yes stop_codon:yes gene_type:complete